MEHRAEVDRRLTELEIKAAFAEDLLEALNTQLASQQALIETLAREVARLREQQPQTPERVPASLRDELPPHY